MYRKFAAFIMTYERPAILRMAIDKLWSQTYPPQKILIVDNSSSYDTQHIIEQISHPHIEYLRVGHNSGPAGAAKIGLQHLASQGYSWIVWCDDDDPPQFQDSFELVLKVANSRERIGIAGAVGSRFNGSTGFLSRLKDNELSGVVSVDSVAGGMVMMINAEVIMQGILPDEDLFFGFEELDFCLRAKQAGYEIIVNGDLSYRYRKEARRLNLKKGEAYKGWKFTKSKSSLWREYYSTRNFCYIMFYKFKLPMAVAILVARVLYKMITGFRVYRSSGFLNCKILFLAGKDAFLKRMGRNDEIQRLVKS